MATQEETLERLSALDVGGHPLLSVYVDLDPSLFPTPATRDAQIASLLSQAQHDAMERDLGRVKADVEQTQAMLRADPTITRGAHALAIFSCAGAGLLEVVRLAGSVEPMAIVDTVPWLEPLAGLISPGAWAVAVISRRDARLFRGGPSGLVQFAAISDELHRRHAQGGLSQARFQRGIEQEVAWHVRRVADSLLRAHRRAPFEHLVIIAADELRPVVRDILHRDLVDVLAGAVDADLVHATAGDITRAVAPAIEAVERKRERALVAELELGLGTGGGAAAGLDEVLSMLEQQRVDTLLVSADSARVDAVEHAVEQASRQSVRVLVVRFESAWLSAHGQIAARLRW